MSRLSVTGLEFLELLSSTVPALIEFTCYTKTHKTSSRSRCLNILL